MTLPTALRLLGFLASDAASDLALAVAKESCRRDLGLGRRAANDDALLACLLPVLRARGIDLAGGAPRGKKGQAPLVVAGAIWREGGIEGVAVELDRVDLRGKGGRVVARATTSAHGQFAASFSARAPLLVRARFSSEGKTLHVSPPVLLRDECWVEWTETGEHVARPGRFEVREAALAVALGLSRLRLSDLEDSPEQPAIRALAEQSGLPDHLVRRHAVAARLSGRLGLPAALVHALLGPPLRPGERRLEQPTASPEARATSQSRANGGPPSLEEEVASSEALLRSIGGGGLEAAVREGVATGELSSSLATEVPKLRAALARALPPPAAIDQVVGERGETWGQVLAAAGVPEQEREALAGRLHAGREGAWGQSSASFAGEEGGALRHAVEVARLAGYDLRVLGPLRGKSARSVARMGGEALEAALRVSHPAPEERRSAVAAIQARADAAFPGDALLRRRGGKLSPAARELVEREGDGFDLQETFIDGHLARTGMATRDDPGTAELRAELLRLQRAVRVAADGRVADLLLDQGYDSAQAIAFSEADGFAGAMAAAGVDPATGRRVHARAQARYRAALELYLRMNRNASGPELAVLPAPAQAPGASAALDLPTYESLFGSQDYGEVEDWESVTSPAAYLVDLLVWLYSGAREKPPEAGRPYDQLVQRRPDLIQLLLGRANTETLVPHIDLACELLEDEAAVRLGADRIPTSTRQTRLSAEEIRAYPEHVNAAVYVRLQDANATMSLPFDLPLQEMRTYLDVPGERNASLRYLALVERFGSSLSERSGTAPSAGAQRAAAATFGLNETDFRLITQPDPARQPALWGTIGSLADFLRRAPSPGRPRQTISPAEVDSLVATRFVNPVGGIRILLRPPLVLDRCKAEDRIFAPALGNDDLDRIHRFLRLARRAPWSIAELDLLIGAVGEGRLDAACLVALAAARQLQQRLCLDAEELAALFRDFEESDARPGARPDGTVPLYRRTFLVRSDADELPDCYTQQNPTPPVPTLDSQGPRLAAALEVPEAALPLLRQVADLSSPDDKVTFANLSRLCRNALLARATRGAGPVPRTLADYAALANLLGLPFNPTGGLVARLDRLRAFAEAAARMQGAGLDTKTVQVLLGGWWMAYPPLPPLDVTIGELRTTTRELLSQAGKASGDAEVNAEITASGSWVSAAASWLGLDPGAAPALLAVGEAFGGKVVAAVLDPALPGRPTYLASLGRLATLFSALRLSGLEAPWVHHLPGFVEAASRGTGSWRTLAALLDHLALARDGATVESYAAYVRAVPTLPTVDEAGAALARAYALEPERTAGAWRALDAAEPPARALDPWFLAQVLALVRSSAALGVAPATLRCWANDWPTGKLSGGVRDAVRGGLPRAAWLTASARVQDRLRSLKRDALVDYLLAPPPAGSGSAPLAGPADFMGRFLIDVEMEPCRDTSRVVQAAAAVQLFLERWFLGLEPGVLTEADRGLDYWRQWVWRKRYRLWEANRRIFLYPENYLSLSSRANATPLFRDFQKRVMQGEATDEEVAAALESYLEGLQGIARLSYEAVDVTGTTQAGGATLGLVAHSGGTPPAHYYRFFRAGSWSPWEEVSLGAVPSSMGLAQGEGRAWLVWPVTTDQPHPLQDVRDSSVPSKGLTYLRYSWAARDDRGAWSAPRTTSRAFLMMPRDQRRRLTVLFADAPSRGALALAFYTSIANLTGDAVGGTGGMVIDRDSAVAWCFPAACFPKAEDAPVADERWKDHYAEYRLVEKMEDPARIHPWATLHFDEGRMLADPAPGPVRLLVPWPPAPPQRPDPTLFLLSVPAPLAITTRNGFATVGYNFPAAAAFVASGSSTNPPSLATPWSALFLSQEVCARLGLTSPDLTPPLDLKTSFLMVPAYHPFASELLAAARAGGIRALYSAAVQESPELLGRPRLEYFAALGLQPDVSVLSGGRAVTGPTSPHGASAPESLDFESISPYALYNYELFVLAPLFVAQKLRSALAFDRAQAYYHCVFNPLSAEPADPGAPRKRYWVSRPFRLEAARAPQDIQDVLLDAVLRKASPWGVMESRPFDPDAIAAVRPAAYQKYVVRTYLENLVAWGDDLYRRGTREDVDEAVPLYQLAESILGERPYRLGLVAARPDLAFVDPERWLGGGNVLVELEGYVGKIDPIDPGAAPLVHLPLLRIPFPPPGPLPPPIPPPGVHVGSLYFRVPPNQELVSFWEVVEGRLRNVRACRTIDGGVAALSLEAAPINPRALADAAALGVSAADAIAMASASPPPYRFRTVLAKAMEHCAEVRSLGAELLAALEKRDAEHLAQVRSRFEEPILRAARATKDQQQLEADEQVAVLARSVEVVEGRRSFYASRSYMNEWEIAALVSSAAAGVLHGLGTVLEATSGGLHLIPAISVGVAGMAGSPVSSATWGGANAGGSSAQFARVLMEGSSIADRVAGLLSTQGGYARRQEEWDHQVSQAELEKRQLDQQIAAAKLRSAVVEAELEGQDAQDAAWRNADALLREKFTGAELYDWTYRRLAEIHRRAYQQAARLASLARACLAFETGAPVPAPPAGWERGKNGLLAAEGLMQYLRDLDATYLSQRLYDRIVTQHVSLGQVAPRALLSLVKTGTTGGFFTLPGWWFKRLYPGLRRRRIRSLSVSIPCVAGPYQSVNATLSYQGSEKDTLVRAISLSTGQNDFGWDLSTRAERYLPFEGISLDADTHWSLEFPAAGTDLDWSTIADVVLHFEYAADEGADGDSTPASFQLFVDVARMAQDAWRSLLARDGPHACSFDASQLLPAFLRGYRVAALVEEALLDDEGNAVSGVTSRVKPESGSSPARVEAAAEPGATVPWDRLRHLLLVLTVEKQP